MTSPPGDLQPLPDEDLDGGTIPVPTRRLPARAPAPLPGPGEGYRVGALLGRGGEGEVHEAVQVAFGRSVAIKTSRAAPSEARLAQRFRSEAAVTALLEHPNIVPVHDLLQDADGRLQLVMKRVGGKTWRQLLIDGALSGDEHVEILLKVCDAIDFAHSRGILHRDLKPENIMVGEHGEVLVMDWGCAAHLGPAAPHPDIPVLADLEGVSGTPSYMPPEQARGHHALCGPWSDVYALGGSLYRMVTGSPPRQGRDVKDLIARAARAEPIESPSRRRGRKVSNELEQIALAALRAEPEKRTRSVADFAAALRRYLGHREVLLLVADSKRQLETARAGGAAADEAFRRAIGGAEQALQMWPELPSARRLLVEANLESARHACDAGAFKQAARQASASAAEARRLNDADAALAATKLIAGANAREQQRLHREHHLRQMRRLAIVAAGVAGMVLLGGLISVHAGKVRTAAALAEAQANLQRAEQERAARLDGERLAAPALLAQARELSLRGRFADALPLTATAAGFAPDDPQAPLQQAQLLIATGDRTGAVAALDRSLALHPDPDVAELRRLCALAPGESNPAIADILVRQGASGAAGALNLAADRRAAIAVEQLRRAWPALPPQAVQAQPDGTLALALTGAVLAVDSLEPLRGLPVAVLDISGQARLHDLAPLAALPLQCLVARATGVRDFAPLRGLRLRRLILGNAQPGLDLALVRGAPLEQLEAAGTGNATLDALAGMPLRELRLSFCDQLGDIRGIAAAPLEVLALDAPRDGGGRLSGLGPLTGKPLRDLSIAYQRGVADLAPLRGAPLRRVILNGSGVIDPSPVLSPALRELGIADLAIADLRPILRCPLESLELSPQRVQQGLDELPGCPGLRTICGLQSADFARWTALQRAIAAANPAYAWNARPGFSEGRLTELRFPQPLRSLEPLAACADLRVLHLAGSAPDLAPLAGLHLVELVFVPAPGQAGLDAIRRMVSLQRLGTSAQRLLPPAEFWRTLDPGR